MGRVAEKGFSHQVIGSGHPLDGQRLALKIVLTSNYICFCNVLWNLPTRRLAGGQEVQRQHSAEFLEPGGSRTRLIFSFAPEHFQISLFLYLLESHEMGELLKLARRHANFDTLWISFMKINQLI
jgi:hypothetical protein